ncbi:pseudouridine synthase [Bacterioplanoides sp.]|uniref:pseudouridine synthase n=1 Tax=Bacterioplanoides sp. TaxID=2066072 RepID=UPI003B000CFC
MQLPVIYQDDHLIAINKPSGLLVHRSEIDRHETRFALQLVRNMLGHHVFPVHRLDKPTSGVLLFAKSSEIASLVVDQWRERAVDKRYLAIVRGYFPESVHLDKAMSPPVDKYAKHERVKPPQEAITDFRCLAQVELPIAIDKYPQSRYSLIEALPKTGRKHQIRRHLKHLAHPIIGDARYGKGKHSRYFRDHFDAPRLLLHAWQLTMQHPVSGETLILNAPVDNVMRRLCLRFGWQQSLPDELQNWSEMVPDCMDQFFPERDEPTCVSEILPPPPVSTATEPE